MADEGRGLKPPQVLLVKCHSSGLYNDSLPISHDGQPVLVELAHMLIDENGRSGNINSNIVKSEGRVTQAEASRVHGLTNWEISQVGAKQARIVGLLTDLLRTLPYKHMKVVSYTAFDAKVIGAALARLGDQMSPKKDFSNLWLARPLTEFIDLQDPWARLECKLVDPEGGYRRPSLIEAERHILGRDRTQGPWRDLPMALVDVLCLRDLYLKFAKDGVLHEEAA
ncbi:MAG: hypothetical protein KIS86_06370 [Devosia sp.]|nr:hypothetical protein [Devosia sp.]